MKHPAQFRLSDDSIAALNALAEESGLSKTEIVEQALSQLLKTRIRPYKRNPLLKFAGTITDEDAEEMLRVIYSERDSKPVVES